MDEDEVQKPATQGDLAQMLQDLLNKVERGEMKSLAMRVQHADGNWEDIAIGFETDEERDIALAKLRALLGQLH